MDVILNLASAPNTTNPTLCILRNKGYDLEVKNIKDEFCLYIAIKDRRRFVANSGPELLGLVTLSEHLGDNWHEQLSTIPDIIEEVMTEEQDDMTEVKDE